MEYVLERTEIRYEYVLTFLYDGRTLTRSVDYLPTFWIVLLIRD